MNALDNLNNALNQIKTHAAAIGITIAGIMVSVYCIMIMLNNDTSPAGRTERWAQLKTVFICAVLIAATGAFIQFAQQLGNMI